MANPKGNQYNINLGSSAENIDLTLDKYKGEIIPYQGFIKKNSPYISNELKNVYTKSENKQTVVDYNSNIYYIENNKLFKNNEETGLEFTDGGFVSIEKTNEYTEESLKRMEVDKLSIGYIILLIKSEILKEYGIQDGFFPLLIGDEIVSLLENNINNLDVFDNYDYCILDNGYVLFQINAYIKTVQRYVCFTLSYKNLNDYYIIEKLDRVILLNSINTDSLGTYYLLSINCSNNNYYNLDVLSDGSESIITNEEGSNDNIIYCVYNAHQSVTPYIFDSYNCATSPFKQYLSHILYYQHIDINSIFKFTGNKIYLKNIPPLWYLTNIYSYIISVPIIVEYKINNNKIYFDKTKLQINTVEYSGKTYYELCSNPYFYTRILDDNSIEYLEYLCREVQMINYGIDSNKFNHSYLFKILFALGEWNYKVNYSGGIYNIDAIDYMIITGSPQRSYRGAIATINSNNSYKRYCFNSIKDIKVLQDTDSDFILKIPVCMYAVKYTEDISYDTNVDYVDILDKRTLPLKSFFILDGFVNSKDGILYFYGDNKMNISQNSAYDYGHIRFLYIKNIISGVSVYEDLDNDGNIVTQWLNIDDAKYIGDDKCIIKITDDNNIYLLDAKNAAPQLTLLLDRYVATNARDYYNAWDIKYNRPVHLFSDWNNRLNINPLYELLTPLNDVEYEFPLYSYATQIMNGYTLSDAIPASANFSPSFTINKDEIYNAIDGLTIKNLDIFVSKPDNESGFTTDINPIYEKTINPTNDFPIKNYLEKDVSQYVDSDFKNIPMFSTTSGSIVQLVKPMLGNSVPVISQNGIFYPFYSTMSSAQSVEECFAIQSQVFAIVNNLIYSCIYNNGVLEQFTPILEITGLKFVASTPEQALFWAPAISALISFRGDNLTTVLYVTDDITEIYFAKYNPQTKDTIIVTDIGIYVLNQLYSFKVEDIRVEEESYVNCFVSRYGFNIVTNRNTYFFSYTPIDDYIRNNINIKTKYYGLGNNIMTITDCVYIRFYNPFYDTEGVEDEETHEIIYPVYQIKFGINILTDKATQIGYDDNGYLTGDINQNDKRMTREIAHNDWDKLTHTYYMRFQPPVQKARGMMIEIDSEIPITNIDFSVIPESIMITKN
ncbi:hypothetical protein [Methanobrevibacter sp.]|uniref:hypothetical protein n=1 Tax=Methanobrevibacter sp. TaxID=66852 RepID=UPI00388D61E2